MTSLLRLLACNYVGGLAWVLEWGSKKFVPTFAQQAKVGCRAHVITFAGSESNQKVSKQKVKK